MFKVGDKVVGNNNSYLHRQGKFGAVSEVNFSGGLLVTWEDDEETHWTHESEIDPVENEHRNVEPAEERIKMTKFKVGDRVVSVNNSYSFCGKEGTITEVFYPLTFYGVVIDDNNENTCAYTHHESQLELVEEDQMTYKTWGEMSPEEKGALLLAHHEGKTIEYSGDPSVGWLDTLGVPTWGSYVYYRVKPEETPREPEREVVAFKTQNNTYIKVNDNTFANYFWGGVAMYDGLAVFEENLPEADEVFYKGDSISFVL